MGLVQHTPDASLPITSVGVMDRTERKRAWYQAKSQNKPDGVCSRYPNCSSPAVDGYKLCERHQQRARAGKEQSRQRVKPEGECYVLECRNPVQGGKARCVRCAEKEAAHARQPSTLRRRAERRQEVRLAVLRAYGGRCVCCGELGERFLTIDHVDRFDGTTPRSGHPLYLWLRRHDHPAGFRVLCMNCNAALGKFGFCPHGALTQPIPDRAVLERTAANREFHSRRNRRDKEAALNQYGAVCVCCGESHLECLTIDHIRDDGAEHRKALNGTPIYRWLRQQGYPSGFQTLCWNCNLAKKFGVCPHQQKVANGA